MESGELITPGVFTLLTLLLIRFGEKIIEGELMQTENERRCMSGRRIWKVGGVCIYAALNFVYIASGMYIPAERFLSLGYVLLYSFFIGIVDAFSHNYYLEMLPGLLLFIPVGCMTNGIADTVAGLLAGICLGIIAAFMEWLFFQRISCGSGDAVFCSVSSALIGYGNLTSYWLLLALVLLIAAILHIVYVKAVKKQALSNNRFVPLLPWFSLVTAGYYAFSLFGLPAGIP